MFTYILSGLFDDLHLVNILYRYYNNNICWYTEKAIAVANIDNKKITYVYVLNGKESNFNLFDTFVIFIENKIIKYWNYESNIITCYDKFSIKTYCINNNKLILVTGGNIIIMNAYNKVTINKFNTNFSLIKNIIADDKKIIITCDSLIKIYDHAGQLIKSFISKEVIINITQIYDNILYINVKCNITSITGKTKTILIYDTDGNYINKYDKCRNIYNKYGGLIIEYDKSNKRLCLNSSEYYDSVKHVLVGRKMNNVYTKFYPTSHIFEFDFERIIQEIIYVKNTLIIILDNYMMYIYNDINNELLSFCKLIKNIKIAFI